MSVGPPPPTAPILPLLPRVLTHYPHKQAMLLGLKCGERKVLAVRGSLPLSSLLNCNTLWIFNLIY